MNKWFSVGLSTCVLVLAGCASNSTERPTSPPQLKMQQVNYSAQPAFRADAPNTYTVRRGDTLWHLAQRFLQNPARWAEIWHANPQLRNPHLIYPGDVLSITTVNGQKRLQVTSSTNPVRGEIFTGQRTADGRPIYNIEPTVSYEDIEKPIPTIPYSTLAPFISKNKVFEAGFENDYPYIIGDAGGSYLSLSHREKIYGHGEPGQFEAKEYRVFRNTGDIVDPVTEEYSGTMATYVANLTLMKAPNDDGVAEFSFDGYAEKPIYPNDILIPSEGSIQGESLSFFPSLPTVADVPVVIRPLENGFSGSQFQTAIINQGSTDGIKEGNVFKVVRGGEKFATGRNGEQFKVPDYEVGSGIVYEVYDNVAFFLIMTSNDVIYTNDRLVMP